MGKLFKTVLTGVIIVVLAVIALKLLSFAIRVVLPIAILVLIAYVIYVLITGKGINAEIKGIDIRQGLKKNQALVFLLLNIKSKML